MLNDDGIRIEFIVKDVVVSLAGQEMCSLPCTIILSRADFPCALSTLTALIG